MSGRFLVGRMVIVAALLALATTGAGCDRETGIDVPDAQGTPDGGDLPDRPQDFADSALTRGDFFIDRVVPSSGPFTGGNRVILRGNGFTRDTTVWFGPNMVQGADHELIDSRRLAVIVPAGEVGFVDVIAQETEGGGARAELPMGYEYDSIVVDPTRGSIAGGTFVTINGSGTAFETGAEVIFGRGACTDVSVVSPTQITCRTPPGSEGFVDVTVRQGTFEHVGRDAFQYYNTTDPFAGGLGGGPIAGSVNVTVIDAGTGLPVEGAFAILGESLATPNQGLTDALGQITFSASDLRGPQNLHVSKFCYERTSFVVFDASDVTIFLVPWQDPMCGMGMPMGMPGRGRNGSFVEGHLVWPADMMEMSWDNVPAVRDGWSRVAFVYTTRIDVEIQNPNPALGGGIQRVVESSFDGDGYPFRIFARPGGFAVYALAGLEENSSGRFVPYVMGIARNILVGPGDTLSDVDIVMDIPLDHYVDVELGARPPAVRTGPDRYRVQAHVDLGGEGVIYRCVGPACEDTDPFTVGQEYDLLRRRDADRPFRFVGTPSLDRALRDGRYRIIAGWYTSEYDQPPYTRVVMSGVTAVDEVVTTPDFLGIPVAESPAYGERIPTDRILRWSAGGTPTPDLHVILMQGGDGNPAWRIFVRGDVTEAPIPDLSAIPDIDDISGGTLVWAIYAVKIPGFDFATFSYTHLNDRYWSHSAYDYFIAQL
jgi:hypothetical protein